jgi:hypothetical protein
MSIDSASTQDDIVAAYLDNLGYDVEESPSKAREFIKACRALLVIHPSQWSQSTINMTFDPSLWQNQLNAAMSWLSANTQAQSGSVRHLAFGDFR